MKTSFIKLTCWALLMAVFVGCERDESALKEGGGDNGLTTVGTNYMAFNIVSDGGSGTRAWPGDSTPADGDFNKGSDEEQAVTTAQGSNVAIFFNENDSFHSIRNLTRVANDESEGTSVSDRQPEEICIGKFIANLKIEEGKEHDLPTKVLIVLNGNPSRLDKLADIVQEGESNAEYILSDGNKPNSDAEYVLGYLTRRLSDDDIFNENASIVIFSPSEDEQREYCTMTNSVYVGTGDLAKDKALSGDPNSGNGQKGEIYNLARFGADNIQTTEDLAKANPLTVHVERLAVKVEVEIANLNDASGRGTMKATELGENSGMIASGLKFPVLIEPEESNEVLQLNPGETDVIKAEKVKWAFSMLGWSTNAVARRMYLFKNLNDARGDLNKAMDRPVHHDGVKSISTPFFSFWNDAPRARSYWAVDGHYADPSAYPVQYRDAKENGLKNSYKDMALTGDDKTASMPLYYYSFMQMRMISMGLKPNSDLSKIKPDGSNYMDFKQPGRLRSNLQYRYCGENVLGQNLINDQNHVWRGAATHVVFFGQLLLGAEIETYRGAAQNTGKSTADLLNSVSDKLYASGVYWDRAGYMQDAYTKIYKILTTSNRTITDYFGGGEDINTPGGTISLFYQKNGEAPKPLSSTYLADMAATLNGVHDKFDHTQTDCNGADDLEECIFRLSAANVSNGDGRVMLGLKKDYELIITGTTIGSGTQTTVRITPAQFLSIAYAFADVADLYAHGRMYYYAPIYHAAQNLAATGAAPEKVGDIGVVRNHWYKLTISSLLKPGIPVSDPEQPIIPNIDPTDRYLGLEIHVLPWHVINQQVTLQ